MHGRSIQRFELVDELGTGGMGTVYRARDPRLEREVAIKVLGATGSEAAKQLSTHDTIDLRGAAPPRDELLAEARMMARLSHPNVLPIYEVGLDDDRVFLVMEYVAGKTLTGWLEQPHSDAEIRAIFAQAARGLAAAHAREIVHRDFKPDNVLIGEDGRARVADFGIAGLSAPTSMVRVADGRGTPRYMAPELWRGEAATARSDVYALCKALAEALGGGDDPRAVRAESPLRELVASGMADAPRERPSLDALIDALEARAPRRRWLLAAMVGGLAVGAVFGVRALTTSARPACADDPALASASWSQARDPLARVLARGASPGASGTVARILGHYDDASAEITHQGRAVCEARQRDELTDAQAVARTACLERRGMELAARVRRELARTTSDLPDSEESAQLLATVESCRELTAPPRSSDRAKVEALWDHFFATNDLPSKDRVAALAAVEREAVQLDEAEVAARAALGLAVWQSTNDLLDASDASAQRAYRTAIAIGGTDIAGAALGERSMTIANKAGYGDLAVAKSIAELALDLAAKPTTTPRTRARIYAALGRADKLRGDYLGAIELLHKGLDALSTSGQRSPRQELSMRFDIVDSLDGVEGRNAEAIEGARAAVERARATEGEHSSDYGIALNVLSQVLMSGGDLAGALRERRAGLAVFREVYPADHSKMLGERADLASLLLAAGEFAEARDELVPLVDAFARNEATRMDHAVAVRDLGIARFELGQFDEGVRLLEQALEEHVAHYGSDHAYVIWGHVDVADYEIELGRITEAKRHLAAAEQGLAERADPTARRLAEVRGGHTAWIALAEHRVRDAEAMARASLAELVELKATEGVRSEVLYVLGTSLVEQQQWSDASRVLAESLALATSSHQRADFVAQIGVEQARVAIGLGRRDEGLAAARAARAVLAKFPGRLTTHAELAAILER